MADEQFFLTITWQQKVFFWQEFGSHQIPIGDRSYYSQCIRIRDVACHDLHFEAGLEMIES